jgi:hypothetical protein
VQSLQNEWRRLTRSCTPILRANATSGRIVAISETCVGPIPTFRVPRRELRRLTGAVKTRSYPLCSRTGFRG